MIRGYCTICHDGILYVTGQEEEVASGPCGHVFHHNCLNTWLRQKKSCPKCRHKITKPIVLYLDEEENSKESNSNDDDPSTLRVNLEHMKSLIKQKDEENTNLLSEKIQIQDRLDEMKERCSSVQKKLSSERSVNSGLKKQMAFFHKQEVEVAEAKKEAMSCKQELQRFTRMQRLIEGSKDDVETMLHDIGNHGGASSEMITQLIILKKELVKVKDSRNKARQAKESYEREISKLKHELSSKEIESSKATEQLNMTESDLMRIEKENASLKKKLSKLELAFNSPSPRSSAITRLMMESPAPMELKRPCLTPPEDDSENDIFNNNPSTTPPHGNDSEMQKAAKWMGLPLVKTTSLHTDQPFKPQPRPPLHAIQARKRPADQDVRSSVMRKGYDGLGGHTKFLKPSQPKQGPMRRVARPHTLSKFIKTTKDGKEPPLPFMMDLVDLDL